MEPVFSVQRLSIGFDLAFFFRQISDVGHGFDGADDLPVFILQESSVFHDMNRLSVLSIEDAFLPFQAPPFKQRAPIKPPTLFPGNGAVAAVENRAEASEGIRLFKTGDFFETPVDTNDGALGIHYHYTILNGIDDGFPVLVLIFKGHVQYPFNKLTAKVFKNLTHGHPVGNLFTH
jgi:hypothetical protein